MDSILEPKSIQHVHKKIRVRIPTARYEYKMKTERLARDTVERMKSFVQSTKISATEEGVKKLFHRFKLKT